MTPARRLRVNGLAVEVYATRREMGEAAAARAAAVLREALTTRGRARVVFAAAPSQNEFLDALAAAPGINWRNIAVFQLDEYRGLPAGARQAFGRFLRERLFDRVRPGEIWLINGNAPDAAAEIERYGSLLRKAPLDLACVGVGENGHIAFNEPRDTDFEDRALVRVVTLDERSRFQQVRDGCFETLEAVPAEAFTLTVPAITQAARIVCVVPGPSKRTALGQMLRAPVSTQCPASVLRHHPDAVLYADLESASDV